MSHYFISPFFEFKRVFGKCYAEHMHTKQILLLPNEVVTQFFGPVNRLMGLGESIIDDLKNKDFFDFLLNERVILHSSIAYKEISNFFVRPQHTYLGLPLASVDELNNGFAVFGVPFSFGNPSPDSMRQSNLIARNYSQKYNLQKSTFSQSKQIIGKEYSFAESENVFDLGDVYINQREDLSVTLQKISNAASDLSRKGNRFIAIGGDHSITYPLFKGVQEHFKQLVCLHIDAHSDLFLLSECHFSDLAPSHSSVVGKLLLDGVEVYSLGLRDFVNVDSIAMDECESYSYDFSHSDEHFLDRLESILPQLSDKKVYLTVDIDVIDPRFFGSVTDPLPNGIAFETLITALTRLKGDADIVAIDIVEVALQADNVLDVHNFLKLLTEIINIFHG